MNKEKFKGIFLKIKNFLYEKLIKINDTPQRVAIGFGLGVFAGILPGTGPLAALFLAFIFRVNRASALAGSLLTNTWLSLVTFLLAIKTGSAIFEISWQSLQKDLALIINHWHWQDFFSLPVLRIILPVATGYCIISLGLGLISYMALLIILKKREQRR